MVERKRLTFRRDRLGAASAAVSGLLVLALADWSYGYFQFLRLVVFVVALWIAITVHREDRIRWLLFAGAAVLLFNPFLPVGFEKGEWALFDLLFAAGFGVYAFNRLLDEEGRRIARERIIEDARKAPRIAAIFGSVLLLVGIAATAIVSLAAPEEGFGSGAADVISFGYSESAAEPSLDESYAINGESAVPPTSFGASDSPSANYDANMATDMNFVAEEAASSFGSPVTSSSPEDLRASATEPTQGDAEHSPANEQTDIDEANSELIEGLDTAER